MTNKARISGMAGALTATAMVMALVACAQNENAQKTEHMSTYDVQEPFMAERAMPEAEYSMAPPPAISYYAPANAERYDGEAIGSVKLVAAEPVSTFSVDVDTGAYANVRRFLSQGQMPPQAAVRTEELINYFRYDYPVPQSREQPFSVTTDMAITPWNPDTRILRVGLRGYDLPRAQRPAANLVFLLDVSGSMSDADKLPLVKTAMRQLAGELGRQDRVSIVVYAGATGVVLEPTNNERAIRRALDRLEAGGSTAGAAGLRLAYDMARKGFIEGGVNRVILATDGDFNVGISDQDSLVQMIEDQRDSGITLTTLGFGRGNYNEAMMEQIADHGNGNYAYIDSAMEARKVLSDEMQSTLFTIAQDVKIQVEFNPEHVSQYRLIGYENRILNEEDFNNDTVDAGDIGAGHQVTALYEIVPAGGDGWINPRRYEGNQASVMREGGSGDEVAFVQLRYKLPGQDRSRLIQRPVSTRMLASARPARGDMAFVAAVAAYGQNLREDSLLNGFGFEDSVALAGRQNGYWREEFLQLAGLAQTLDARR
ncbi:vWA domain-containing protein [Aurantiacibacter zhengii]|uniref:VWA domain-containing protein n=1 Tax=Aurantiacibacter zhengii TaxID=2307003 RepID=A0A418NNA6_9SPHN|nr:VWA domain-containing protein [Aurantiacibacter zhengii]RIV83118.1 VWA domain-containing protein [Aurantiacibacter zhengii]